MNIQVEIKASAFIRNPAIENISVRNDLRWAVVVGFVVDGNGRTKAVLNDREGNLFTLNLNEFKVIE